MTLQDDISRYLREWHQRPVNDGKSKADVVAAGLEREKVIIDHADLPEVTEDGYGQIWIGGAVHSRTTTAEDAAILVRLHVALLLHIQSRDSEAEELARRRDELSQQAISLPYHELRGPMQHLINQLITAVDEVEQLKRSGAA